MPKTEKKTKYVKIRITESEFNAINTKAKSNHTTISNVLREACFNSDCCIADSIRNEIRFQKIFNLIQHTKMPRSSREKLIKELNNHDDSRY
ncbi:plasmid mobilization protein [Merdimonas faecis]